MDVVDRPVERPLCGREASFLQVPHLLQKRPELVPTGDAWGRILQISSFSLLRSRCSVRVQVWRARFGRAGQHHPPAPEAM